MTKLIAWEWDGGGGGTESVFGTIKPPVGVEKYAQGDISGMPLFINNILKLMIVGAGLFTLFNLVLAGYSFLSAGEDPKKVTAAWAKIWQSLLGLAVAAGAFILAAIFGKLIFGDWDALLQLQIVTPQ